MGYPQLAAVEIQTKMMRNIQKSIICGRVSVKFSVSITLSSTFLQTNSKIKWFYMNVVSIIIVSDYCLGSKLREKSFIMS